MPRRSQLRVLKTTESSEVSYAGHFRELTMSRMCLKNEGGRVEDEGMEEARERRASIGFITLGGRLRARSCWMFSCYRTITSLFHNAAFGLGSLSQPITPDQSSFRRSDNYERLGGVQVEWICRRSRERPTEATLRTSVVRGACEMKLSIRRLQKR